MTDELTPDQEAPPDPSGMIPQPMPCKLHLVSGKEFVVDGFGAWGYTDPGVFATGHFKGYSGEIDVLISYDQVEYIELDFAKLKKQLAAHEAASRLTVIGDTE